MKSSIMLLCLFAALATNVFSCVAVWDPQADYDETHMVYATHCPQCQCWPTSPGYIQCDESCQRRPCVTGWAREKREEAGVIAALAKNPQLWISIGFFLALLIASGLSAGKTAEWELVLMAVFAVALFVSAAVLFLKTGERPFALACFLLFVAAALSFGLRSENTV